MFTNFGYTPLVTRIYTDLEPTDPEWTRWTGAHVLRRQAAAEPAGDPVLGREREDVGG